MLKKCWITPLGRDGFSLSFESDNPTEIQNRVSAQELLFPDKPTEKCPLRHTICLGVFSNDELAQIMAKIKEHLHEDFWDFHD
jgi:hypothetical protein